MKRRRILTSNTMALSRRTFLGSIALASAWFSSSPVAEGARPADRRWIAVRDVIASGAIGDVRCVSVLVPENDIAGKHDEPRVYCGELVPAAIADVLEGALFALSQRQLKSLQSTVHEMTNAHSLACELEDGRRIVIASISSGDALSVTVRGTEGALYLSRNTVAVESRGRWQEVRV